LPQKPDFTNKANGKEKPAKKKGKKAKGTEQESQDDAEACSALAPPLQLTGPAGLPPKPVVRPRAYEPVKEVDTEAAPKAVVPLQPGQDTVQEDSSAKPEGLASEAVSPVYEETAKASVPDTPQQIATPSAAVEATPIPAVKGSRELYERIAQVGEGTYGKVYKARNTETGTLVAMKRIRMESEKDGFPVTAVREIKLLQSLDNENVVALHEMMVSKGYVYMVFEYVDHDLTGILHHPSISFSPANLKSLMQQLLVGLDYIHWRGVLHRDLKGSNILLSKYGDVKIADFGLAKFYAKNKDNDYTNRVITQWYKPPELLFGETVYGPDVDMWSSGCAKAWALKDS
jgi:CTD kinase subunit alpha